MEVDEYLASGRASGWSSRLIRYHVEIRRLREGGASYQGIANYLRARHDLRITKQAIQKYCKKHLDPSSPHSHSFGSDVTSSLSAVRQGSPAGPALQSTRLIAEESVTKHSDAPLNSTTRFSPENLDFRLQAVVTDGNLGHADFQHDAPTKNGLLSPVFGPHESIEQTYSYTTAGSDATQLVPIPSSIFGPSSALIAEYDPLNPVNRERIKAFKEKTLKSSKK